MALSPGIHNISLHVQRMTGCLSDISGVIFMNSSTLLIITLGISRGIDHVMFCFNVRSTSTTLAQYQTKSASTSLVWWATNHTNRNCSAYPVAVAMSPEQPYRTDQWLNWSALFNHGSMSVIHVCWVNWTILVLELYS